MKTKPSERPGSIWRKGVQVAVCSSFVVAYPVAFAADAFPRLDAPGPGYREQSARVLEAPRPAKLEAISFMYPFMAPQPSFDGTVPAQPLLPRGDGGFKLLYENDDWNFRVYDTPARAAFESTLSATEEGETAPAEPAAPQSDAAAPPEEAAESEDVVRLPVIPEVILPVPKEVDAAKDSERPFVEHLPLELRPR